MHFGELPWFVGYVDEPEQGMAFRLIEMGFQLLIY